jgi:hypothetical protein
MEKQQLESHFTLESKSYEIYEITLSPNLLKEHFSSEESFYCKICDNLIVDISQCGKCDILYCKKDISLKLETTEN